MSFYSIVKEHLVTILGKFELKSIEKTRRNMATTDFLV